MFKRLLAITLTLSSIVTAPVSAQTQAKTPQVPCSPMNPQSMQTQECVNYQMSNFYYMMNNLMAGMSQSPSAKDWYEGKDNKEIVVINGPDAIKSSRQKILQELQKQNPAMWKQWEQCKEKPSTEGCKEVIAKIDTMTQQMAFGALIAGTVVNMGVLINRLKEDSDKLRDVYPDAMEAIKNALHRIGAEVNKLNYAMGVMSNTMGRMGLMMPW